MNELTDNQRYYNRMKEKKKEVVVFCECCQKSMGYWSKYTHYKSKSHIKNESLNVYPEDQRQIMKDLKKLVEKVNRKTTSLGYASITMPLEKIEDKKT
jgi:predicted ATPase